MSGADKLRGYTALTEFLHTHCGIKLADSKKSLVQARLGKRLDELDCPDLTEYLRFVQSDHEGQEISTLVDLLSTNVTSFFREPHHFDHLRDHVLTRVKRERASPLKLRVWSAACSSGEEPYSIAMCLGENLSSVDFQSSLVLATDISTRMLKRANEGVYREQSLESMPLSSRERWFTSVRNGRDTEYRVRPELSQRVRVRRLNLIKDWPMRGPFDAIFCRNVLIYFDGPTREALIQRFSRLLRPGGTLYVGHAESLTGIQHDLEFLAPTTYGRPERK